MMKHITKQICLFFIALLLCSTLLPAFHHHADLREHSDCAICKVAHDLATGDTPELLSLATQQLLETSFAPSLVLNAHSAIAFSVDSRASPV